MIKIMNTPQAKNTQAKNTKNSKQLFCYFIFNLIGKILNLIGKILNLIGKILNTIGKNSQHHWKKFSTPLRISTPLEKILNTIENLNLIGKILNTIENLNTIGKKFSTPLRISTPLEKNSQHH